MDKNKSFTTQKLLELSKQISNNEIIIDLQTFNDEMTISQVVRFFEKQKKQFTKTMIQNYVRIGVLPPPMDKRYYTKKHLILLALIDQLKEVYSLDEIKLVFSPILKDTTTFEDDVIDISKIYQNYIALHKQALTEWQIYLPSTLESVNKQVEINNTKETDKDIASAFLLVLTLMAQSIATKQLIKLISNEYLNID